MSEEGTKKQKGRKVNRMSKEQAKAVLAALEAAGDKGSDHYLRVKAVAEAD